MLDTQQITTISPATKSYDVVIVGAGPYGLSVAAHLQAHGIKVAIFGKPLQLWREHMPRGMLLRSYWWASSLSDPAKRYRIEDYLQEIGQSGIDPLPMETFTDYGLWFQKHVVPNVDETYVSAIEGAHGFFKVTLANGQIISCRSVVMAIGLGYYVYRPAEYRALPQQLVSHTSNHTGFERFAGKVLVVVGGGQAALETAALAHESGALVHVVSRRPIVWMKGDVALPENRPLLERLRYPKAGISADWFSWGLEHFPYALQKLPMSLKAKNVFRLYGPMGAEWLRSRLVNKAVLHEAQPLVRVRETDNGLEVALANQKKIQAEHMILGTGFHADISRLPMLHRSLVAAIRTYDGSPVLNHQFESSVPGLYFPGYSSVLSCGPLYRFIVGADASARRVARAIVRDQVRV